MMKSIKNIFQLMMLLLVFFSCSDEQKVFDEEPIQSVRFTATSQTETITRGTPIKGADVIENMGVYAYQTGSGTGNNWAYKKSTATPNLIKNMKVFHDGNGYVPERRVVWPKAENDNVTFFAYSPMVTPKNGITITSDDMGLPRFSYSVPRNCADQPDFMVAQIKPDLTMGKNGDQPVNFHHKHLLTSINFIGKGVGKITRILVRGIKTTADLVPDNNGDYRWTNLTGNDTFEAVIDKQNLSSNYQQLTRSDGYLMMIPQTLPANSYVIVVVESGDIIYINVSNQIWRAGQEVTYNLDITDYTMVENYNIPKTYVGAFWKANQIGERIIRMPIESSNNTFKEGEWKAEVFSMDSNFNAGDIVFSKEKSLDSGITYRAGGTPADMNTYDSYYQVTGDQTSITQPMRECRIDGGKRYVYFRIGLKSRYTPTASAPARYAIVKVSYGHLDKPGRNKTIYIFLRQGESPDYLIPSRPLSKKLAVCNLSASASSYYVQARGAVGTNYVTQAGRFFKWLQEKQNVWMLAYMPVGSASGWTKNVIDKFWGQAYNLHKVSPNGLRRPREGRYLDSYGYWRSGNIYGSIFTVSTYGAQQESFNINDRIDKQYSELAQSLFSDVDNPLSNSSFGYYADGFFDRHAIVNNTVKGGTIDVAYAGRLFYNPETSASVFFPATGYRHGDTGAIVGAGSVSRLWTSAGFKVNNGGSYYSPTYMYRAVCLEIGSNDISYHLPYRSSAASIRCVVGSEED